MSTDLPTLSYDIARAMAADLHAGVYTCEDLAQFHGVDVQLVERWIAELSSPDIAAVQMVGFRDVSSRGVRVREYRWNSGTAALFERMCGIAACEVIARAARR